MTKQPSYIKFIILTMPRSGSNLLSYLLHDHPHIQSMGEVYCIERVWGSPGKPIYDGNRTIKMIRDTFPKLFLRYGIYHTYPSIVSAVGFRIFYHQLDHFTSIKRFLIQDKTIQVIHLVRNNLLETYTSLCLAHKTNHWSSLKPNMHTNTSVTLSYTKCRTYFEQTEQYRKTYTDLFKEHPFIRVTYENIVNHTNRETDKILNFLGVPRKTLSCSLVKQNQRSLKEVISNYDPLKRQFSQTNWSYLFP